MVSGVARGLSVSDSTLTGKIDPESALAHLTWSFTFKNVSDLDREARAQILLPPGGVVDSARIIFNGKERKAVVTGRGRAREIYRSNVKAKRDPLLVSQSGTDQVLVQCYPIGHDSKVQVILDILAPLYVRAKDRQGMLFYPAFAERNFQFDTAVKMHIDTDFWYDEKTREGHGAGAVQALLDPAVLSRFPVPIDVARNSTVTGVTVEIPGQAQPLVAPVVRASSLPQPLKLAIVVDGSGAMSQQMERISTALSTLPEGLPVSVAFVGDTTKELTPSGTRVGSDAFKKALEQLKKMPCAGGQIDYPAIIDELQHLPLVVNGKLPDQGILWIHAAQPVHDDLSLLHNALSYRKLRIYDLQIAAGPDELMGSLENENAVVRVPKFVNMDDSIAWINERWDAVPFSGKMVDITQQKEASRWVQEYLAKTEIDQMLAQHNWSIDNQAATYAIKYGMITPVTSAVVSDPDLMPEMKEEEKPKRAGHLGFGLFRG
ncbi:MAG: VIT domain-containing protein, partial [Terriglobales bacterium]